MQVLLSLQFFLDQAEMLGSAEGAAPSDQDADRRFEELKNDPENTEYVQQLHLLFDKFAQTDTGGADLSRAQERDLTCEDLGALLACMGQHKSPEELNRLFNLMDADGSGGVSFAEFCTVMVKNKKGRQNIDPHDMAEKMYRYFDADGDGTVSPDEMISAFQNMGKNWDTDDIRSFLETIDADGSGTIEKEEFIVFITKFLSQAEGGN